MIKVLAAEYNEEQIVDVEFLTLIHHDPQGHLTTSRLFIGECNYFQQVWDFKGCYFHDGAEEFYRNMVEQAVK